MSFTAATIYHLDSPVDIATVETMGHWVTPDKKHKYAIGLVPLQEEIAEPIGNSGVWFRVRISEKKIPSSEFILRMKERMDKYEQTTGSPAKGNEKLQIRDEIELELIAKALPSHKDVDVLVRDSWLLVMSSSAPVCEVITAWMRKNINSLKIVPASAEGDLYTFIKSLLRTNELAVDTVSIGARISGKVNDMSVSITESDYSPDLLEVLQQFTAIKSCELLWSDFRAKINDNFVLSGIKTNFADDTSIDEIDDAFLRAKAEAFYYAQRLPNFLRDVCVHIGGLKWLNIDHDSVSGKI